MEESTHIAAIIFTVQIEVREKDGKVKKQFMIPERSSGPITLFESEIPADFMNMIKTKLLTN